MEVKRVELGEPCSVVMLEIKVTPLTVPQASLHSLVDAYAATTRSFRNWAVVSHISRSREGEATVCLIGHRRESLVRLDNVFLGWKRALERLIQGSAVERRQWTAVADSKSQIWTEVHRGIGETFEEARQRVVASANEDSLAAAPALVSGPLQPLLAPSGHHGSRSSKEAAHVRSPHASKVRSNATNAVGSTAKST